MDCSIGILRKTATMLNLAVVFATFSSIIIAVTAQSECPCNPVGTADFPACNYSTQICPCLPGFGGPYCYQEGCSPGYYISNAQQCLPCLCDRYGSLGTQCTNSTGECSCVAGVGGAKCDRCLDESQWWDGQKCVSCDCYEYFDQCNNNNGNVSSAMCNACSASASFMPTCQALCQPGSHKDSSNTCVNCPACTNNNSAANTTWAAPGECQRFTEHCLRKCSYSTASQSKECETCFRFSSVWNCSKLETPGEQPAKKANSSFRNYYVYVAAGGGALLCTALISTIIFLKKRRTDQKPMMPLWTIELKQDDQVSFTDYNDVDVMYLDDSYLMEPSEVFTTSTDSMDERIGYKTLS